MHRLAEFFAILKALNSLTFSVDISFARFIFSSFKNRIFSDGSITTQILEDEDAVAISLRDNLVSLIVYHDEDNGYDSITIYDIDLKNREMNQVFTLGSTSVILKFDEHDMNELKAVGVTLVDLQNSSKRTIGLIVRYCLRKADGLVVDRLKALIRATFNNASTKDLCKGLGYYGKDVKWIRDSNGEGIFLSPNQPCNTIANWICQDIMEDDASIDF